MLVNVDYGALVRSGHTIDALARSLDKIMGAKSAHLIGHSFGACLGMCLKSDFLSRSFICPTFSSTMFHMELFCVEIASLTRLDIDVITPIVDYAVDFKTRYMTDLRFRPRDDLYLPLDDPYFLYDERVAGVASHVFSGGHFDVHAPVKMISEQLLGVPAERAPAEFL